jgi:hypothetical protein
MEKITEEESKHRFSHHTFAYKTDVENCGGVGGVTTKCTAVLKRL